MKSSRDLRARLADPRPLLLDGANGTELERRGARMELPLWSAHALLRDPELVARVHADYAAAGAELLTANTFRTQRRTLARAGLGHRAAELTALAVELARSEPQASQDREGRKPAFVAGSAPPLEDCYRPDLVPGAVALEREHAEHAALLAAAGVDAILVETMNTLREARVAARVARETGIAVLVSFVCWDGPTLLSGERLSDAVAALLAEEPAALLVNCLPPSNVPACLPVLAACGLPWGVYANLGAPVAGAGRRREACSPEQFATLAAGWLDAGARLIGGCCGTTPAHIRSLAARMRE